MSYARICLSLLLGAALAVPGPPHPPPATAAVPSAAAPAPSMVAAYSVYDRVTGRLVRAHNGNLRFRSASVVKLLIALDHLWSREPAALPAADRARLTAMLRSSDDGAASHFWGRNGSRRIVSRMVARLGLTATAPPPASMPGWWGYTAMTAHDTVRVYRYILRARPSVRTFLMANLHRATARGADGFDQRYGVLAFAPPRAAKQGWSGFGGGPPAGAHVPGLDLHREALHSTGTASRGDRHLIAIYTLHARGTTPATARTRVTQIARALFTAN
ncbi:MAG TPA: hypothetical protein VES42_00990 [Pilimelia sp.]|nr:hypothetical protein [Pilimelia sp.]